MNPANPLSSSPTDRTQSDFLVPNYEYGHEDHSHSHAYLFPAVIRALNRLSLPQGENRRIFDLGCGNGSTANFLHARGFHVVGVDPSEDGIRQANRAYPMLRLEMGNSYENLAMKYGTFPVVLNLEVIEHVYAPRQHIHTIWDLLEPGGHAILSTPYHGYLKNLAMAVTGKMDPHFTALWDHGHIKFWSIKTLTALVTECGFEVISMARVGRLPWLAKSMVFVIRRPV